MSGTVELRDHSQSCGHRDAQSSYDGIWTCNEWDLCPGGRVVEINTSAPSIEEVTNVYHMCIGLDIWQAGKADGSDFNLSEITSVLDDEQLEMVHRIVRTLWSRRRPDNG